MTNNLRFDGSLWINVEVALRSVEHVYGQAVAPLGLAVLEWYILRALYEHDGQHASELAHALGRLPTSFTPILDKLEQKELIERRPDPADRRAIHIYLTAKGRYLRNDVLTTAKDTDARIQDIVNPKEWMAFQHILARLQALQLQDANEVSSSA